MKTATTWALKPVGLVLLGLIRVYQYVLSPLFPPTCRYLPTCSEYAAEAVGVHGPLRGGWLAFLRFMRCNPLGGHGYDPVPKPKAATTAAAAIKPGAAQAQGR